MDKKKVWKKTAKGDEEIRSRTFGLSQNPRRVLILIDGMSDEEKIVQKGSALPDDVKSCIQELAREGYIVIAERVLTIADVKNELIRIARETLGPDAETVIEKIKEAPDDKEGLVSTMSRCKKLVKMVIDEEKAESLIRQCTAVLNELM
ncbi:MAG: hypothetical protein M0Z89_06105 [Nitrospiraceae bacterium]|nr:hypothetical protein [Nitrospiraceae bacterium]